MRLQHKVSVTIILDPSFVKLAVYNTVFRYSCTTCNNSTLVCVFFEILKIKEVTWMFCFVVILGLACL